MAADPLKPLLKGMFGMLLLAGLVLFVHTVRNAIIEQEALAASRRTTAKAEQDLRTQKVQEQRKVWAAAEAREKEQAAARAREHSARQAAYDQRRPIDVGIAFGNLLRRANAGEAEAQNILGNIYLLGMDRVISVEPENFGIRMTLRPAEGLLGAANLKPADPVRYMAIPKLPSDLEAARRYFRLAALQGNEDAMASLAHLHAFRLKQNADLVEGYQWTLLSLRGTGSQVKPSIGGHNEASLQRCAETLAKQLTPAQLKEAQERADAFRPTKPTVR